MIRYQTLDKCFSRKYKRYYIEDLVEACNEALLEFTGKDNGVKRRQVLADIAYMESPQGWDIPLEHIKDGKRVYYRYSEEGFSINKKPLTEKESELLKEAVSLLGRFKGMPQFDWIETLTTNLQDKLGLKGNGQSVIGFEQNIDYIASQHLSSLFFAIIHQQVLRIHYRTFSGTEYDWILHPYYIKQYNNRWYLFGLNNEYKSITCVPLDRIEEFSPSDITYIPNTEIDFETYFDDIIGITIPKEPKIEKVLLKFSPERFPYIESKPLHGSMKIKDRKECVVEVEIVINKDFESLVFSFGNHVEVLSPEWFREQIASKIKLLSKKYLSSMQNDCTGES